MVGALDTSIVDMAFPGDGTSYVTGWFFDSLDIGSFKLKGSTTAASGFLAKRLRNGTFDWAVKTYPNCLGIHLLLDADKHIWLNSIAFQFFPWHLSKWTPSGEKLWQIESPLAQDGYFKRLSILDDNSAVAVYGNVYPWTPGLSLLHISPDGAITATNQILSPTGMAFDNYALPYAIFDDRKNIIFSGNDNNVGTYKYSSTGRFLWSRTNGFPGSAIPVVGPSGYIYAAGFSIDPPPTNSAFFIRLYKPTGEEFLTKNIAGRIGVTGVVVDNKGTAYIAGNFEGDANFDGFNISAPVSYPARGIFLTALEIPYAPPEFESSPVFIRNVDAPFSFTNLASSTHPLTYTMQSNHISGLSFDSTNTVLNWTPSTNYAGTTNVIAVIATDTISPSNTATQIVTVIVPDLITIRTISVGAKAGTNADIPVSLTSSATLTNLSLDLEIPETSASSITILSDNQQVAGTVTNVGGSRYHFSLTPTKTPFLKGTNLITIRALTKIPIQSEIHDLNFITPTATSSAGFPVPDIRPLNGRFFLVVKEPLLEVGKLQGQTFDLGVYGEIGATYLIEATGSLGSGPWKSVAPVKVGNLPEILNVPLSEKRNFYRAVAQ